MRHTATLFALLLLIPCPARAQQRGGIAGTYTNGPATFVFGADGRYTVKAGETVMILGRYQLNADTLVITDEGGPFACPSVPGPRGWCCGARR